MGALSQSGNTDSRSSDLCENKTLLVVGGGIEAIPGILLAKNRGLKVVVTDADPNAPGFEVADDTLLVSTYDVEGTTKAAVEYHSTVGRIHGVICIATDVPHTVAEVADKLGLPGIPLEAAQMAVDKLSMKRKFASDGLPVPWFSPVKSPSELYQIAGKHGYSLVLKPVDSRGARGVLRLSETVDLDWAYDFSSSHSPSGRVMVEKFLTGPQVSTESIVLDSQTYTLGFADRNYEFMERYAPNIIENGGELPSCLPFEIQERVKGLVAEAAKSMGIRTGVVKGDIVVQKGLPHIIELAARLSGGYFCSHEIPLNTGVDFVGAAIRLALGEGLEASDLTPRFNRFVAQRYLFPKPGRVIKVDGADQAASVPGIEFCELRVAVGDTVRPIDSHPARAGMVIATGRSRDQAVSRAEAAVGMINVVTEPL
jgi:biotin carboxylase